MIGRLIDRFLWGIMGLFFIALLGWIGLVIVREGATLYALAFIISAISTGYVMEKIGL